MKRLAVVLSLAVVLFFVLGQSGMSDEPQITQDISERSSWKIPQPWTGSSVKWQDADNTRFAVYDAGTPEDVSDDVVLDKETGLVWERSPSTTVLCRHEAIVTAYYKHRGGCKGWRLPTIEEVTSIADFTSSRIRLPEDNPLPSDNPFINMQPDRYWTASAWPENETLERCMKLWCGDGYGALIKHMRNLWCVHGGQGGDAG